MKHRFIYILSIIICTYAGFAQVTTIEIRDSAAAHLNREEIEMKQVYDSIMKSLDDDITLAESKGLKDFLEDTKQMKSILDSSQKSWLLYRDESCEFIAIQYGRGTFRPIAIINHKEMLTRYRKTELRGLLKVSPNK